MTEKPNSIEIFKNACLAWAYGMQFTLSNFPETKRTLLSKSGDIWLKFQNEESEIEIQKGSPIEVAKKYVEDCTEAGYNRPEDFKIYGNDEKIEVEIYDCFYSPICNLLKKKDVPITCPRTNILEGVIHRGSEKKYISIVKVGEKCCKGTLFRW